MRTTAAALALALLAACGGAGACAVAGCSDRGGGGGEGPSAGRPQQAADRARRPPEADALPRGAVILEPPGVEPVRFRVEIAADDVTRGRGLMFRRQLDADAGMLFVFDAEEPLSFWMRNTYLPLDMIFITADLRVLGVVENAEPLTDNPREVEGLSKYVLEVNAGTARRYGIGPGVPVRFEGVPAVAEPRGASRRRALQD